MKLNYNFFEDPGMRLMERFLDVSVQRQSLISGNIANIDTPGYRTVDIDFQRELEAAGLPAESLALTNSRHLQAHKEGHRSGAAAAVQDLTLRNDLNNVNVDREMAQLSTNALKFSMIAQLLGGRFRTLKATIQEGA